MNRDKLPGKKWGHKMAVTLGRKSKFEDRNVNNQRGKDYCFFNSFLLIFCHNFFPFIFVFVFVVIFFFDR